MSGDATFRYAHMLGDLEGRVLVFLLAHDAEAREAEEAAIEGLREVLARSEVAS